MVRNLLIEIDSDPAASHRPAEAVRIAAGVGAWGKVQVHLYFKGSSVRALDEFADELTQGESFSQYLAVIPNHGGRIIVDKTNPQLGSLNPSVAFEARSSGEIAEIEAKMDHIMKF